MYAAGRLSVRAAPQHSWETILDQFESSLWFPAFTGEDVPVLEAKKGGFQEPPLMHPLHGKLSWKPVF